MKHLQKQEGGKRGPPYELPQVTGSGLGGEASTSGHPSRVSDETLKNTKKVPSEFKALQLLAIIDIRGMKVMDQQLMDLLMVEFLCLCTVIKEDLLVNVRFHHSKVL